MRTYEDVDAEIKYLIRDMNYAGLTRREYEAADDMLDELYQERERLWLKAMEDGERAAIYKSLLLYFPFSYTLQDTFKKNTEVTAEWQSSKLARSLFLRSIRSV